MVPYAYCCTTNWSSRGFLSAFGDHFPRNFALVDEGELVPLESNSLPGSRLSDLVRRENTLVLKPVVGGGGNGFTLVEHRREEFFVNGESTSAEKIDETARGLHDCLVCEFVRQHRATARIFPRTTNTAKLLTVWDEERRLPFVAAAVLRIGRNTSYPLDTYCRGTAVSARRSIWTPDASARPSRRRSTGMRSTRTRAWRSKGRRFRIGRRSAGLDWEQQDVLDAERPRFWLAGLWTFAGALGFLGGSYLLIPELFDGEPGRDVLPR